MGDLLISNQFSDYKAAFMFRSVKNCAGLMSNESPDLPDRHHGKDTDEYQERGKEEPETSDQYANVENRGREHPPAGWQEAAMEGGNDDNETLKPHADIHQDRNCKQCRHTRADSLPPKTLRGYDIAANQNRETPSIRASQTVQKREALVYVSVVPSTEKLG
jgi:hypothetical protein